MMKRLAYGMVLATALVCVTAMLTRQAGAQTISVHVTQVLASNKGDYVDPTLGALGERLKRTYPYRSYRKAGSSTRAGQVGETLEFDLSGAMMLTLQLTAYDDPVVTMRAAVTRGGTQLVGMNLQVKKGRSMIISVPLGDDKLILSIGPTVK